RLAPPGRLTSASSAMLHGLELPQIAPGVPDPFQQCAIAHCRECWTNRWATMPRLRRQSAEGRSDQTVTCRCTTRREILDWFSTTREPPPGAPRKHHL